MPVTLLYTTGLHQEMTFKDLEEKKSWMEDVAAVKEGSSNAYYKKEADGESAEVRGLYNNWIASVHALAAKYGEERTPQDIKWALNSAEEALGLETTKWQNPPPANLFG